MVVSKAIRAGAPDPIARLIENSMAPRYSMGDEHVHHGKKRKRRGSSAFALIRRSMNPALGPLEGTPILDLPPEILHLLCDEFLDTVTRTCLGLTCTVLFNITEHYYPWPVNLYMRSEEKPRRCLGHLLTDWMSPKYQFDHSWGKFFLKKYQQSKNGQAIQVEIEWRVKEKWKNIKMHTDKAGAVTAYPGSTHGGF